MKDDCVELYEQIFNKMVHDNMTEEELDEVALELGKMYLERGIYYKLDLKYCTREEFQNMDEQRQAQIDYFSDDINEERPDEHPTINNMHTRTGKGVKPSQMSLMTCNGEKSALDIAISMVETYRILNPGKSVPVLKFENGDEDRHLLERLVDRIKKQERRQNVESVSYFHDQKSDEFFADEQGQRRYIVPAQTIGQVTVHTPIEHKKEAKRVVASDMRNIEQNINREIEVVEIE